MIDPVQLPILLKALDFIFEEGRKILDERRERRRMNLPSSENPAPAPETEVAQPAAEIMPAESQTPPLSETKQDLLTSQIDEILWRDHEFEVRHLVKLLETYTRNYYLASEQYARWGSALVPPIVVHNMTEAENAVVETLQKLETVLSKVYKKDIKTIA